MKNLYISIFVFLISTNFAFGQSVNELIKRKDSLNFILQKVDVKIGELKNQKSELEDRIEVLQKQVANINREKNRFEIKQELIQGFHVAVDFMGGILGINL